MNTCILCGNTEYDLIHKGTRDREDIDLLKCKKCGLEFLSVFPDDVENLYANGEMRVNQYDHNVDAYIDYDFESWRKLSEPDDERRFLQFRDVCKGKSVLEFGCGNGGFLKRISNVASIAVGVDLDDYVRENISREGLNIVRSLNDLGGG